MTQQPIWRLVANLGDVNVADYGGFLVYVEPQEFISRKSNCTNRGTIRTNRTAV